MQDKLITRKIVLSLAGVLAAAAFAPEASALPAFARQVGRACNACHTQHFPVLNAYGRDFKASGYTLMGRQKTIKGEKLSITDTLNAAVLLKVRYQKDNTTGVLNTTTMAPNAGNGQWQFGDEFSLFFGGRVADNIGFLLEGNLANHTGAPATTITSVAPTAGVCPAGTTPNIAAAPTACLSATTANGVGGLGGLAAGLKLPMMWDLGGVNVGLVPFTTDALGVQYGYELSSGGVLRANRWAEHRRETSAIQYNADRGPDAGAATGIAFVAKNDLGFINYTAWSPSFAPGGNGGAIASTVFKSSYIRVAATPTWNDWSFVVGLGAMSGTSFANIAAVPVDTKETFFDFQAQGLVGGNELSVYMQYAKAPQTINGNAYNGTVLVAGALPNPDRKAWTIGADYSVIPHALSVGLAYRNAQNGGVATANGDNAVTVTAVYDMYQNIALVVNHSQYSGSAHNATVATPNPQKRLTTFMLEGAW